MATASLALGAWGKGGQSGGFAPQPVEAAEVTGAALQPCLGQDGSQVFCIHMHLTSLAPRHPLALWALQSMEWVK